MFEMRSSAWVGLDALLLCSASSVLTAGGAHVSESGTSVYLLGSGGPGTAIMLPN